MKMNNSIKASAFIVALSLLAFAACHKPTTTTTSNTATTDQGNMVSDHAQLEGADNDVISTTNAAASTGGAANLRTTSCATVTNDTISIPHVLTINFGTGCTGSDGRTRSGEIIVTYNGHYKDSASSHTISFNNYYLNGYRIGGSKSVTNMGRNSSGNYWYNVTVNDSLYLSADSVATMTGSRTRTWLAGYATATRWDDVYQIAGSTTIRRANGNTYTFAITTPLTVAVICPWVEAGVLTITGTTMASAWTIDYGTTGCDNNATLTVGSHVYDIHLR